MTLSDAACRNLKPKEKPYKKGDSQGLYLLIKPNGTKLWRLKYFFAEKEKTYSIGQYPEISLAKAREERDKARKLVREGTDPSFYKQEQKRLLAEAHLNTFEQIARKWHEKNIPSWSENHARTVLRRLCPLLLGIGVPCRRTQFSLNVLRDYLKMVFLNYAPNEKNQVESQYIIELIEYVLFDHLQTMGALIRQTAHYSRRIKRCEI